jgi:hypothetical protein
MPGAQHLIVISGPPASGKSALAACLQARHRWPLLAKDTIKECLFDSLGVGDRTWSRRLSDASFELMFRLAAAALGVTPVLMIEGNFRPEHGPRIDGLAIDPGTTVLHVSLRSAPARGEPAAPRGTSRRRACRRVVDSALRGRRRPATDTRSRPTHVRHERSRRPGPRFDRRAGRASRRLLRHVLAFLAKLRAGSRT